VLAFITLLFIATIYALTRFVTFSNVRYLLPAMPLLLIASYAALVRLLPRVQPRRLALITYALLLVVSAERTVDPLSRRVWGTFPFGSHEMLRMASMTRNVAAWVAISSYTRSSSRGCTRSWMTRWPG
jgi:hypothetical protein